MCRILSVGGCHSEKGVGSEEENIVKRGERSYFLETLALGVSESSGAVVILFRKILGKKFLEVLALAMMTLGILVPSYGQGTKVFNCSSGFTSSGVCGAASTWSSPSCPSSSQAFCVVGTPTNGGPYPAPSGSQMNVVPVGSNHVGLNMNYMSSTVNVQAFTTTFTFVPNGWNLALVIQNNTNSNIWGADGYLFAGGAGCESGFYQAFPPMTYWPTQIFALELDSNSGLSSASPNFTASSVQMYGQQMSPCIPNDGQAYFYVTDKISTSPVLMNAPAISFTGSIASGTLTVSAVNSGTLTVGTSLAGNDIPGGGVSITAFGSGTGGTGTYKLNNSSLNVSSEAIQGVNTCFQTVTGTCDAFTATVDYNGANLTLNLYDATAGGSCPGASCFTKTWNGVNIPSMVGGTTAYIGLAEGAGAAGPVGLPLYVNGWSYTVNTPTTPNFGSGPYTGQPLVTANPTASPAAESYSSAQMVTLSSATPNSYICYLTSTTVPIMPPQTDNIGGCIVGTLYTDPISISSTTHLYAIAGNAANSGNTTGGQFSAVIDNAYTIGGIGVPKNVQGAVAPR